ncbi:terpene cyclase [Penicillium canescens]|nr:terpene cyclase [Penicillium canescens]
MAPQSYQEFSSPRGNLHSPSPPQGFPAASVSDLPLAPASKSHSIFHHEAEIERQIIFKQEKIISAPLDYLSSLPGKDIRGKLIFAFNEWFKIPEEKLEIIKRVVGLLHVASLLIDDIEDFSKLRRGFPVAHSIFGIAQTINSANYTYFRAQKEVLELGKPKAVEIFTEELLRLHRGQGMDLYWRDSLICPTEEEYLDMVANKTGGLFRLAIKLIQLESDSDQDCVLLVDLLGIIFQIRDDYQNLQSDLYTKNKGFGEDITEGKFSYPIIHSILSDPGNSQLMNILRQKSEDEAVKRYTIQIIESTGSFEYTRQKLVTLTAQARGMLDNLGDIKNASGLASILEFLELKQ